MIKHYCDRCNREIVFTMDMFDPINGTVIPQVRLIRNGTIDGDPVMVRKTFDLCRTCFDNVLAYTEESKI